MNLPSFFKIFNANLRSSFSQSISCQCIHTRSINSSHYYKEKSPTLLVENAGAITVKSDTSTKWSNTSSNDRLPYNNQLVQLDDPDSFGLLGRRNTSVFNEEVVEDEGDKKEEEYIGELPLFKDKLHLEKYRDMIRLHVANKRIKEAVDILQVRMKEDRVKPDFFIYNLLIGSCARMGYTHKAFKLFNDMKRRGLKVTGGIYTSLFNACANSPWKEDGINRATKLHQLMIEKGISLNITNYNCMIKAYGRCGDTKKAFEIADEMLKLKIKMRAHTFNFLLQACITDKESGFRTALVTWRKMLAIKEKPNLYSFNLMLRCVKECGFGDNTKNYEILNDLLSIAPSKKSNLMLNEEEPEILDLSNNDSESSKSLSKRLDQRKLNLETKELPNFLARYPEMKNTIDFGAVRTVEDRFLMVGGMEGLFKEMNLYKVSPDIKFFSQLLELIPSTAEEENKLLEIISKMKIKTDTTFYNMLMKKRCFRKDYDSVKEVLAIMEKQNKQKKKINRFTKGKLLAKPDIVTYGILAMCCETKESAVDFVDQLDQKQVRINPQILGSLMRQAMCHNDFEYMSYVMEIIKEKNIQVNDNFIRHIDNYLTRSKEILSLKKYIDGIETNKKFVENYGKWMKMLKKQVHEEPEHPWEQFRTNQPEGFQHHKDHVAFKKKIYRTYRPKLKYQVKI